MKNFPVLQNQQGVRSMSRPVSTVIEAELCIGCGKCIEVCPSKTLSLADGKAVVSGEDSLGCDHCAAVCPTEAVRVGFVDEAALQLSTVETRKDWLPHGRYDAASLVQLMRSRRSCRSFSDEPVPREALEDLVKIGAAAPSGTNCQLWTFTVLPNRKAVMVLGDQVARFFDKLNGMAEKPTMRLVSRFFMHDALGAYYREYYKKVKDGLEEYRATGRDRLFHGATAAIVIGSRPGASCPAEDALLAAGNILLAAHAMGFASCLIGFAVEAIRRERPIAQSLGIPDDEKVYAVIALGKTKEKYRRVAGRRAVAPRWFEG